MYTNYIESHTYTTISTVHVYIYIYTYYCRYLYLYVYIQYITSIWLVVTGTWILYSHILGMSSSQLTFIFFRGVGQPATSQWIQESGFFFPPKETKAALLESWSKFIHYVCVCAKLPIAARCSSIAATTATGRWFQ